MVGDHRVEDRGLAVVRLAFLRGHRHPEPDAVQVDDVDVVSARPESGGGAGGEGVAVAVG